MAAAAPAPLARSAGQNTAAVHQPQPQQQQQRQQAMQVPSFSSITMAGTVGMLAALPAHSLTHLHLEQLFAPCDGAVVSAALVRLSSLQELRLGDVGSVSCDCLAALAQLKQLTSLELGEEDQMMKDADLQQLLVQPLPLRVLRLHCSGWDPCLDLSRWTQLQEFTFSSSYRDGELHAVFPAQLQKLQLGTMARKEDFQPILPLQQLRSRVLIDEVGSPEMLLRLAQLPALQHLSLRYYYFDVAEDAAAAFPQMPQLQELEMYPVYRSPSRGQWQAIRSGLAACTSLTKLQLEVSVEPGAENEPYDAEDQRVFEAVELCGKVAGLTNLKELCLGRSYLVPGDALALTTLTGLTRLELQLVNAGVGDLAATAIAGSCQQLRHLDLRSCSLGSMACLAAVRHLTQLTELHLDGNSGLTVQGLMLLTRLKRLKHLGVDRSEQVTDQVVQCFWTSVRQQQL
uniref:Uncharacterized protein n=1 Tax=Tetradesmus obliquus TaxID=3088 RepID=A0A383VBF8_TETOB|eukprot:jgi/Sobl393_1/6547/SZX62280.1